MILLLINVIAWIGWNGFGGNDYYEEKQYTMRVLAWKTPSPHKVDSIWAATVFFLKLSWVLLKAKPLNLSHVCVFITENG